MHGGGSERRRDQYNRQVPGVAARNGGAIGVAFKAAAPAGILGAAP